MLMGENEDGSMRRPYLNQNRASKPIVKQRVRMLHGQPNGLGYADVRMTVVKDGYPVPPNEQYVVEIVHIASNGKRMGSNQAEVQPNGQVGIAINANGHYSVIVSKAGQVVENWHSVPLNTGTTYDLLVSLGLDIRPRGFFLDANLEDAVRREINKPNDLLRQEDLGKIRYLNCYGGGIANLDGLENLASLNNLIVVENSVVDISPIASLKNLQILILSFNKIANIESLANLPEIDFLFLAGNPLSETSWTVLSGMTNLTTLGLEECRIRDINFLTNLKRIENLYLNGNQITDISPLREMFNLVNLSLPNNMIKDISPIIGLKKLDFLHVGANNIQANGIQVLQSLTTLQYLYMSWNPVLEANAQEIYKYLPNLRQHSP